MKSKDKCSLGIKIKVYPHHCCAPQTLAGPPHLAKTSHLHHPLAFQHRHFHLCVHWTSKFYEAPPTSAFKFPHPAHSSTGNICAKPPRIMLPATLSEHLPTGKSLAQLPSPLLLLYSKIRYCNIEKIFSNSQNVIEQFTMISEITPPQSSCSKRRLQKQRGS